MDKNELAEYRDIEAKAEEYERVARVLRNTINAQVKATLAVAARLEALCYAVRHLPERDLCPDCSHPDRERD